jgi:DNA-binding Lrp family transcriptional regulator
MTLGFILIKAEPNYEHKVYNQLSQISDIVKLHPGPGEYDLIAQVESKSYDNIKSMAEEMVKSIEGVIKTKIVTDPKF